MDCISLDDINTISWQKCGRVGYTKIVVAALGYFAEHKKRNVVLWQPTDGDAQDFVKDEVDPMLRDVPVVGDLLKTDPEKKSKHNTMEKKSFIGSVLDVKGGKSSKNYRRMTKDVAIYDEIDGFDPDIDKQGDATSLGDKRLTQSPFPKSIRGSTPTLRGESQIEQSIDSADMRFHRFVPCPACGELQQLAWAKIKFNDHDPKTARHECESCGHGATYADYPDMDAAGVWRSVEYDKETSLWTHSGYWIDESAEDIVLRDSGGDGVDWPEHVGFWVWGAYSYDLTWPKLVDEFLRADKEKKRGAVEKLKTFVNMRLGETWAEIGETVDENMLYRRREQYDSDAPAGVQVITAWADVQADRIECEVCGWGFGEESWSLDYWRLYGDPMREQLWLTLQTLLQTKYTNADGAKLDIKIAGVDCGYLPDEVEKFCKRIGVRYCIPTKGHAERNKPVTTFPRRKDKRGLYMTMIGTDTAKEIIYRRYDIHDHGPGYCHFPIREDYDLSYFEQVTAEKKILKYTHGVAYYQWDAEKRRNEALDCKVGNLAMIRVLQQHYGIKLEETEKPGAQVETVAAIPREASRQPQAVRNHRSPFARRSV